MIISSIFSSVSAIFANFFLSPYRRVLFVSSISFNSFWAGCLSLVSIDNYCSSLRFEARPIKSGELVEKVEIARVRQERLSPRRATLAADWSRASRESNQRKLVPLYFYSSNLHCMSKQRHYAAQIWRFTLARQNSLVFTVTLFFKFILEDSDDFFTTESLEFTYFSHYF